jgi:hypothetical protein
MAQQERPLELRVEGEKNDKSEVMDMGRVVEVGSADERERKLVMKVSELHSVGYLRVTIWK